MNPEASFDVLAIVARLEPSLGPVLPSEVHLFAYLACLLALYSGRPVSEWGYEFAGTTEGSPFSARVDEALVALRRSYDLDGDSSGFKLSELGRPEYELLRTVPGNASREVFVAGACASVLALPIAVVRSAMSHEPALRRVGSLGAARQLLETVDVSVLYDQFAALSSALGTEVRDVMVPAVAWLTYLVRIGAADSSGVAVTKAT